MTKLPFPNALKLSLLFAVMLTIPLTACFYGGGNKRLITAQHLAHPARMFQRDIKTDSFTITTFEKIHEKGAPITIYIAGDGVSSHGLDKASVNPTPLNPVALHLATRDRSPNVIYLTRPCQYQPVDVVNSICKPDVWLENRFTNDVIASINQAIEDINTRFYPDGFHLVGYNGGAGVATLIAARRNDVKSIRTVGGLLDTDQVAFEHSKNNVLERRYKSEINPLIASNRLAGIPQHHFIGEWDEVITPQAARNFKKDSPTPECTRISLITEADHDAGWVSKWPELLKAPLDCNAQ